jgi:folate-binding protein YgfZ
MTPQYRTITTGAAWLDISSRGHLSFVGPDAATFLHALVTNDVTGLPVGRGAYAAWLTPQGRMIADLRLLREADQVLAEVPEGMAGVLASRFDQLIFSEQVRVSDDTAELRGAIVFGGQAAAAVAVAVEIPLETLEALPVLGHVTSGDIRVVRTDDIALPNFGIWMPAARWEAVTARLRAEVVTAELFDALRIEAGRPKFGVDMTTDTIPLEAGLLDRAISTAKGCYVGQEVIVRILHRGGGRVVKQLVQLIADPVVAEVPAAGTPLIDEGREVGLVTSAARSLVSDRVVMLGYVHRDSAAPGRALTLAGGAPAVVSGLVA